MSQPIQPPDSLNLPFIEDLFAEYLRDPNSVSADWQDYFKTFVNGESATTRPRFGPSFHPPSLFNPSRILAPTTPGFEEAEIAGLQERLNHLIRAYRVRGHMVARIDPLGLPRPSPPELDPAFLGFTRADMDQPITNEAFQYDGPLTVRELLQRL